jgi:hypothetical protein
MFFLWSRFSKGRPNWAKLAARANWRRITPLYLYFLIGRNNSLIGVWRLVSKLLKRRHGSQQGAGAALGQNGGSIGDGGEPGVATGAGVTALPEEDFADAEDEVEAQVGRAEGVVEEPDGDLDGNAPEEDLAGVEDVIEAQDDQPEEAAEELGSDLKSSAGYSGGGGSRKGSSATSDYAEIEEVSEFAEPDLEVEYDEGPAMPELPQDEQMDTLSGYSYQASHANSYDVSTDIPKILDASGTPAKTGSGIAAPIIGVAAVSSMAASGLGLSNKLGGAKKASDDLAKQEELPVVAAKEATGNFCGNLKGEYVVLASGLSILFSGASLKAGMGADKNKGKPDDRFRIGYGTSAVLSGGAIQERS